MFEDSGLHWLLKPGFPVLSVVGLGFCPGRLISWPVVPRAFWTLSPALSVLNDWKLGGDDCDCLGLGSGLSWNLGNCLAEGSEPVDGSVCGIDEGLIDGSSREMDDVVCFRFMEGLVLCSVRCTESEGGADCWGIDQDGAGEGF